MMNSRIPWSDLEHQIHRNLKKLNISTSQALCVAVSGGADSVACFHLLKRLGFENLRLIHIHHGDTQDAMQMSFRDQALSLAQALSISFKTPLQVYRVKDKLNTETEFRNARYSFFKQAVTEGEYLVLGHHFGDELESWIIQWTRGASSQMRPGEILSQTEGLHILRPLSQRTRGEIESYLKALGQKFLLDPSNQDLSIFRNWLRQIWWPQLEEKKPGASEVFYRSARRSIKAGGLKSDKIEGLRALSFDRNIFSEKWGLDPEGLISVVKNLGVSLTWNQALEVLKQLDSKQGRRKLELASLEFELAPRLLTIRRRHEDNASK